jgi:hypothetical protein
MLLMSKADVPSIVATQRGRVAVLTELLHAALDVASLRSRGEEGAR